MQKNISISTLFPEAGLTLVAYMSRNDLENCKNIVGYLRFGIARSESEYLQACNISICNFYDKF